MPQRAFAGLTPAPGVEHAAWVVEALAAGEGVLAVVPGGFDAYVRVLHPLPEGERWADVAPAFTGPGDERYEYPYAEPLLAVEGEIDPVAVDLLGGVLAAATEAPARCHFGLWVGWGELHPGSMTVVAASTGDDPAARRETERLVRRHEEAMRRVYEFVDACPVVPGWGGRDTLLFDGPIDAVAAIGHDSAGRDALQRRSPQWWWPADRAWFVATEIDYPWTYVAGSERLAEAVLALPGLEAVRISADARW